MKTGQVNFKFPNDLPPPPPLKIHKGIMEIKKKIRKIKKVSEDYQALSKE